MIYLYLYKLNRNFLRELETLKMMALNHDSIEEDFNPYMDLPITKLVALYDYSYQDDDGNIVNMTQGEEYHLLQKQGDWWEVIRDAGDVNELSFYVPANYVEIVGKSAKAPDPPPKRVSFGLGEEGNDSGTESLNTSITKDASSSSTTPEKDNHTWISGSDAVNESTLQDMDPDYINSDRSYMNYERKNSTSTFSSFGNSKTLQPNSSLQRPDCVRRSFSDEGDYINLDRYRNEAGIKSERTDSSGEDGLYSNLQELHKGESPPAAPDLAPADAPGNYVKTLLDVWDVYIDPSSNRIYYINKETNERTFKPPRHPNKEQHKTSGQKPIDRKKSAPELKISRDLGTIPDGWRIEERDGEKLYVNSATNETWGSNLNVDGERYYYKHGSNETAWELPKILTTPDSPSAPQTVQRERSPNQSPKMGRSEETDLEKKSLTPAPQLKDALDGYLNKAKIVEAGKSKSKKWSQSYVKLSGSNLVFYKNEAAAKSQPGSPHGRPEFIVPLLAAQVDKDKDKSSKKNVISLRTSQGDQYLLQHDDQATILKWLTHLSVAISGLGGNKVGGLDLPVFAEDSSSKEKRKGSFKIFHGRNNSASEGEGTSLERRKRLMIKDKLINFVSRRPSKESLEQKGIIKDAVFGAHLKVICDKEKGKIPKFVQKCVNAIEKRGLDHDGLYRISGNLAQIQKLRCQVDQDSYNLDEDRWDVHVLTGSLKLFFRELKEPLYTYQMFDKFIPILAKEKNSDRQKAVKELISTLPKCNYETMKFLFNHLTRVIEMSKENRMQVHNVAIVFGPTLIWPEKESPNMAANMVYQSRIVEYCLLEYKYIFR